MSDHNLYVNYDDLKNDITNYQFAGLWERAGAAIIDGFVMLPFLGLSLYIAVALKSLPLMILNSIIMAVYKPLLEYQYGATLGKMALGIKVINEKGGLLTPNQAIIRYIPWLIWNIIDLLLLVVIFNDPRFEEVNGVLEYYIFAGQNTSILSSLNIVAILLLSVSIIVLLFNEQKQALHDKWAKTYCIYKD